MIFDADNNGSLDVDELTELTEVRAEWPEEPDEKCKCGKLFERFADDDDLLTGDGLEDFSSKKWKNRDFEAATCDTDGTPGISWAEAECLCEGLATDDEEDEVD